VPKADFSPPAKHSFLSLSVSICCGGLVEACWTLGRFRLFSSYKIIYSREQQPEVPVEERASARSKTEGP
jgi:hypothetical protein